MPNKENVIKGLEIQLDDLQKYADSDEILTLTQEQAKEIVSLLKEQPEIIKCKDCKHYKSVDGIFPVCNKWAKGCQTEPDGYCFLGEKTVKE